MADPTIRIDHDIDNSNVFTKPTGLTNGDYWDIRYTWFGSDTSLPTDPSGFTQVTSETRIHAAGDYIGAAHWYKLITNAAGEANITITRPTGGVFWDGGNSCAVQNAVAIDDTGSNRGTSTGPTTGAAVDCTVTGGLLILGSTTYGQNCSTPTGMTQDYEIDGGDTEGWHESISGTLSGGTRSSTIGASVEWIWSWVVYKAAAAGGVTVKPLAALGVG